MGLHEDAGDVVDAAGFCDLQRRLAAKVETAIEAGLLPVSVGGDHSISLPPIEVIQSRQAISLLWLDSHHDFDDRGAQGVVDHRNVLRRIVELPRVERVVALGYRGFTREDERVLGSRKVDVVPLPAARLTSLATVIDRLGDRPCYVSLDIDFLDPSYAPATASPVAEGAEPGELMALLDALWSRRRVVGFDLVEVSPLRDVGERTLTFAATLLQHVCELAVRHTAVPQWSIDREARAQRRSATSGGAGGGAGRGWGVGPPTR